MPTAIHDRIALASEQLEIAIALFLDERSDAAALTLAGAAEEILGQALKLLGQDNALTEAFILSAQPHRLLHGTELARKSFADGENQARNAMKHMRTANEKTVEADLRRAAQWMLVRACTNYNRLGLNEMDAMRRFDNWFWEHEVGI